MQNAPANSSAPTSLLIAHVLPFEGVGGTEIATVRLAHAASAWGYRSVFFYPSGKFDFGGWLKESCGDEFPSHPYDALDYSIRHAGATLSAAGRLAARFREMAIDLIHCSDIRAAYFVAFAARLAGIPAICHVRNRYRQLPRREKLPLHLIRHFVFVSRNTWDTFCLKVPSAKGTVLYDGLDAPAPAADSSQAKRSALLHELQLPENSWLFGMVARVGPQKDFLTLIKAAATVVRSAPQTRFVIIGDHSSNENYRQHYLQVRQWIEEAGMSAYFAFSGFRADVADRLLPALDAFVLCTHWEGFPLAILEAMSRGLPVVATAVDGIPEVVTEGRTGLLHEHGNPDALAAQMLKLIRDPVFAAHLAANGRQLIARQFSLEAYTEAVGRLYASLLGESGARAARREPAPAH